MVYVTDDYFASDLFNGELPARVLAGRLLRGGQLPLWTNTLCSGFPLVGMPADPIGVAAFALLPPAPALDLYLIALILVAAHGAYSLARTCGADRTGAVLAGLAFAGSGYIACQLRHLSIVSTIAWLPVGLVLVDRAIAGRRLSGPLLGLVYANQVLSGFPQSAYICGLAYGSFAVFRVWLDRRRLPPAGPWLRPLAGVAGALALGAAAGAVVLLPLSELGSVSDRAAPLGWKWSIYLSYWPPNVLQFLFPYFNGDFSNRTYIGPPLFWEDYGYVGAATALLAIYGAYRERRRPIVIFLVAMSALAFLLVLGRRTPVFHAAYLLLPGMKLFRAPSRFLVVVELGLAVLGAIGLTTLRAEWARRVGPASRVPLLIGVVVCVATAADLFIHQPRQNPMVPAERWLAPPPAAEVVRADAAQPRTFSPRHRDVHRRAEERAQGWVDVEPYFEIRDLLEPNTGGGYWNIPSADCYAGIAPRWHVDVWSDHSREASMISRLAYQDFDTKTFVSEPPFTNLMRAYGVTHVLSPYPARDAGLTLVTRGANASVYRVEGSARARFVPAARWMSAGDDPSSRLLDSRFDPDREILLADAPDGVHPAVQENPGRPAATARGEAIITREDVRELVIDAVAPQDGFLLLADTYYPGWTARVDGAATPIYRANISVRGIAVPEGHHRVTFTYNPSRFFRGLQITVTAFVILVVWLGLVASRVYA